MLHKSSFLPLPQSNTWLFNSNTEKHAFWQALVIINIYNSESYKNIFLLYLLRQVHLYKISLICRLFTLTSIMPDLLTLGRNSTPPLEKEIHSTTFSFTVFVQSYVQKVQSKKYYSLFLMQSIKTVMDADAFAKLVQGLRLTLGKAPPPPEANSIPTHRNLQDNRYEKLHIAISDKISLFSY